MFVIVTLKTNRLVSFHLTALPNNLVQLIIELGQLSNLTEKHK